MGTVEDGGDQRCHSQPRVRGLPPLRSPRAEDGEALPGAHSFVDVDPVSRFVRFIWTCHRDIEIPLEASLQRSVELAQFLELNRSLCFLPQQQQCIRWAIWELLYGSLERAKSLEEVKNYLEKIYCGPLRRTLCPQSSATLFGGGAIEGGASKSPCRGGSGAQCKLVVDNTVWNELNTADETTVLTAFRACGRHHAPFPRHAAHCASKADGGSVTNRASLLHLVRALESFQSHSGYADANGGACCSHLAKQSRSVFKGNSHSGGVGNADADSVPGSEGSAAALRKVEALTTGCPVCSAEGLVQGCWLSVYLLQLMNTLSAAHLCAAPLLLPRDAVSLTSKEAVMVAYHLAQHQLHLALGMFFSIVELPAASKSRGKNNGCASLASASASEKEYRNRISTTIGVLAHHALVVCVHVLSSLRALEHRNVYAVLLHASVLAFCDRNGTTKASHLIQGFVATVATMSERSQQPENLLALSNNDIYDAWISIEPVLREGRCAVDDQENDLLVFEQITTGLLFSVFLKLLEMRDLPSPLERCRHSPDIYNAAIVSCLRARDVLDEYACPRLQQLCDSADGSLSSRGRQSFALYWLLRGMLFYNLNALSLVPLSSASSYSYQGEVPIQCMQSAVGKSDAAREFTAYTLAPQWMGVIVDCELEGGAVRWATVEDNDYRLDDEWRLPVSMDAGRFSASCGALPPQQCVTEVALLPLSVMNMWLCLARALFRSAPADLLSAHTGNVHPDVCHSFTAPTASPSGGGDVFPLFVRGPESPDRGIHLRRRRDAVQEIAATKLDKARRRAANSEIGFWSRWYEVLASHQLLGFCGDRPSLLNRYHQLLLPFAGIVGCDNCNKTPFIRALQQHYPIVPYVGGSRCSLVSTPDEQQVISESVSQLLSYRDHSLAAIDCRLRVAVEQYERQCIRPAPGVHLYSRGRGTTGGGSGAPVNVRGFTRRSQLKGADRVAEKPTRGRPL